MSFSLNPFRMTKEQRYRILLWMAVMLFFAVSTGGAIMVYNSYRYCKSMEEQEQRQARYYNTIREKFETQREHVQELMENPDFLEHVARGHLQMVGKNEILFRFE